MQALVRRSDKPGDFGLQEVAEPMVSPGTVKVRVVYAGICGSDLHIYQGLEPGLPQGVHGHEFSGVVAEVGEGVSGWAVGERVTVEHTHSTCGQCAYCLDGRYQLCRQRHSLGFDKQGAFAQYVCVSPRYLHRLPPEVSLKEAALTEPLACIIHGIHKVPYAPAARALVAGPGAMGLLCGLVMQAYGMEVDVVGGPGDEERLALAADCGLRVCSPRQAVETGYPIAADCSGSDGGIAACLEALHKGGTLLQVGITTRPATLPYHLLVYKELSIEGTFCHVHADWEQALALLAQKLLDVRPLITATLPLGDWRRGFEDLLDKKGIKTLFQISSEEGI